jgi:hypothetical protein
VVAAGNDLLEHRSERLGLGIGVLEIGERVATKDATARIDLAEATGSEGLTKSGKPISTAASRASTADFG